MVVCVWSSCDVWIIPSRLYSAAFFQSGNGVDGHRVWNCLEKNPLLHILKTAGLRPLWNSILSAQKSPLDEKKSSMLLSAWFSGYNIEVRANSVPLYAGRVALSTTAVGAAERPGCKRCFPGERRVTSLGKYSSPRAYIWRSFKKKKSNRRLRIVRGAYVLEGTYHTHPNGTEKMLHDRRNKSRALILLPLLPSFFECVRVFPILHSPNKRRMPGHRILLLFCTGANYKKKKKKRKNSISDLSLGETTRWT